MTDSVTSTPAAADADTVHEVVIVGSGPAGLTAAIYTARANLAPLMIEGEPSSTSDQPGGQLMLTTEVENFPGFRDGIMGPDLMAEMRAQAERFGTTIVTEKANAIDFSERPFTITTREATYRANSVIVSTGAQSLMLGLEAEERLIGHGLSTCATCDGFFFRGHEIAVVGGGDSAIEEANFLTKFADKVTLIVRRDELRASAIMQDRAKANPKIEFLWNTSVTDINGTDKVESVDIVNNVTGETGVLDVTGPVHRHRPQAEHGSLPRRARHGRGHGLPDHPARLDLHQRPRRVRLRRREGLGVPPGDHRGRQRLHGRHRRRTLARRPALTRRVLTPPPARWHRRRAASDAGDGPACGRDTVTPVRHWPTR